MRTLEEAQNAQDASSGNPEAVRALWQTHRRWVAAILLAHKPREVDLEDLLQEVAVSMVAHMHELKDPAAVRPWLRAVAINTARTAGRRTSVRRRAERQLTQEAIRRDGQLQNRPSREDANLVLEAAQQLPEAYREPLMLRAVRGMSYRQIADVLDIPFTTVETRLARARRMLREQLESSDTTPSRQEEASS